MARFGTNNADMNRDAAAPSEEARTMSLLGGIASGNESAEIDGLVVDAPQGNGLLGQGTALLLLVTLIAAGSLYAMRVTQSDMSGGAVGEEVEARIEKVLAKLAVPKPQDANPLAPESLQTLFRDTNSIVAMFAEDPTEQQVPIEYVKKNPFTITLPNAGSDAGDVAAPLQDRSVELRRRQLESELAGLELQTVMQGRNPVAIINGQLVQTGQQLGSFKIVKIENLSVELGCDGLSFSIEMESASDRASAPRRRR